MIRFFASLFEMSRTPQPFAGVAVCLTGRFHTGEQQDVRAIARKYGAYTQQYLTGSTQVLVVGALGNANWLRGDHGLKISRARAMQEQGRNITIMTELEFLKKCR